MLFCEKNNQIIKKEPLESKYLDAPFVKNGQVLSKDLSLLRKHHLLDTNGSLSYVEKLSLDKSKCEVVGQVDKPNETLKNQVEAMIDLINQGKLTNVNNWWYMPELKLLVALQKRLNLPIISNYNLQKLTVRNYNKHIVNFDRLKFEIFLSPAKTILVSGLPGTGKSATISGRIDTLVANGEDKNNILVINKRHRHHIKQRFNDFKGQLHYIMADNIEAFGVQDLLYIIEQANEHNANLLLAVNSIYTIEHDLSYSSAVVAFNLTTAYRYNHYILDYAMPIINTVNPDLELRKKYYSAYGLNKLHKLIKYIDDVHNVYDLFKRYKAQLVDYIKTHNHVVFVVQNRKQLAALNDLFKEETDFKISNDTNSDADIRLLLVWQAVGLEEEHVIAYLTNEDPYQYTIILTIATQTEFIINATNLPDSLLTQSYNTLVERIYLERTIKNELNQTE